MKKVMAFILMLSFFSFLISADSVLDVLEQEDGTQSVVIDTYDEEQGYRFGISFMPPSKTFNYVPAVIFNLVRYVEDKPVPQEAGEFVWITVGVSNELTGSLELKYILAYTFLPGAGEYVASLYSTLDYNYLLSIFEKNGGDNYIIVDWNRGAGKDSQVFHVKYNNDYFHTLLEQTTEHNAAL